jgi:hypothetical protein
MSTHAAAANTMEAIVRLLRTAYDRVLFNGTVLGFDVFVSEGFERGLDQGVSLFLYRIYPNGVAHSPQGRMSPGGRRQRTRLPLDLHFMATAWARKGSLQHEIPGWMIRMVGSHPPLIAGLLNSYRTGG